MRVRSVRPTLDDLIKAHLPFYLSFFLLSNAFSSVSCRVSCAPPRDHNETKPRKRELLRDADLRLAAGKRYGLLGPNGRGKSTLLRFLAARELPVPAAVDVLLVEQEVRCRSAGVGVCVFRCWCRIFFCHCFDFIFAVGEVWGYVLCTAVV